jgi:mono/diheme cytochrome c family protein
MMRRRFFAIALAAACAALPARDPRAAEAAPRAFIEKHCVECHDAETKEAGLDVSALKFEPKQPDNFARWVKIHDRLEAGEMPPKESARPPAAELAGALKSLKESLREADLARLAAEPRTALRRLTRVEYENTMRDLFDMPGLALQGLLPADGSAHGFDKNADALDISHVNMAKYVEAADHVLNLAIATQPKPPTVQKRRISLCNSGGFVAHVVLNGDGVLLKNKQPDPEFPPSGEQGHIDEGAHERMGSFKTGSTVGLFRHEDESLSPYFIEHVTIYPGLYRVRTSLWSFQWDKGKVLPSRGTEAARLSVVQLTGDGRGGQHPSYVLGYFDAPSIDSREHELITWLNHNEIIGFNVASLAPVANYNRKGRAMAFTGPGIACDWLDIEGPLHKVWPPASHRLLFEDLPLAEFKPAERKGVHPPRRLQVRQLGAGKNRPDPPQGLWTVESADPRADADRLLAAFLPRAFRRPVEAEVRKAYVAKLEERLAAGDCFESAMRWAYRAALCSPDFLFHVEPAGKLDDYALACRLSYFLWNSLPDDELVALATPVGNALRGVPDRHRGRSLREPEVLRAQVERLLADKRSERFVEDFLGQWLSLRKIAATDPDKKLYPEFSPYLQDSMVAETRAYFRELLDKNLGASHLVKSDFAMLNEKLAVHYGISGVSGSQIRRVPLPADSLRGGFLTQASILKITANGTTTSPVPRGAFVMARLLGQPPDPPPANVPAVEPDVRGATTIREQLARHMEDATCAACHARLDPPGFALESFDVIGGFRTRYRSIGAGDSAPRGAIDPFIGISFKLGPTVDPSGELPGGREFSGVTELQGLLASDTRQLSRNLVRQLAIYAAGRDMTFSDRDDIEAIVSRAAEKQGGIRTLLHELVQSSLFQTK